MQNNERYDLSKYLIHFFRDIDLGSDSAIALPQHMGWHTIHDGLQIPAGFLLRAALRNGRLWATWSYRGNKRTIFGESPAVCFTDMPIPALIKAGHIRRAKGEAMSPLALVFPKARLHKLGARPVIYGLSGPVTLPAGDNFSARILPDSSLPSLEQYRYVSHAYLTGKSVDWTHEREWRWPYRAEPEESGTNITPHDVPAASWKDIPGLNFYQHGFQGIGVIVETERQADLVLRDMLTLVDNDTASETTFGFILVSSRLPSLSKLQDQLLLSEEIDAAMVSLDPYFKMKRLEAEEITAKFSGLARGVESAASNKMNPEFGECWLWLHDNTADLTRALLRTKRALVTKEGRYLVSLPEFSGGRSLSQRRRMTEELASLIREEFQTESCVFSANGSYDPETASFDVGDFDEDISFFNFSWNC